MPVLTTVLAKGAFPMDHPLHMGIHMGPMSPPAIRRRVATADLVLALGTELTDLNLGAAKPEVARERSVWAIDGSVRVSFHQYTEVELREFVGELARARLPRFARARPLPRQPEAPRAAARRRARPLTVNDLLLEVNRFLAAQPGYHVFAESGDMLFGGPRGARARARALLRPGLLRVDGLRRAGGARRADRHRACGRWCSAATAPSR